MQLLTLSWILSLLMIYSGVIPKVESANILGIFPTASYSHQMPVLSVCRELAKRGHNLTVITTNPFKESIPNYTEIDLSFTYNYWKPREDDTPTINLQKRLTPWEITFLFIKAGNFIVEQQLNSTPIQNFIKYIDNEKPKFDLVLYEDLHHTAYLGLVAKLGHPPLISMLTLGLLCSFEISERPTCNPSYMPDIMFGFSNKMTFWERFQNHLLYNLNNWFITPYIEMKQEILLQKYFNVTIPTAWEMSVNKSLLMLSNSWLYQYPRPIYPYTIMLGPLHIGETKPLPQVLENWIQDAKEGVIYFSLGSNMKSTSLDKSKKKILLDTFARFPNHRIIWKWEDENSAEFPSNVLCMKWLPQQDLLAHPKIKLFITQCGLQSMQEAVHFSVPILAIPMFADQDFNAKKIKSLKIGEDVIFEDMTAESLYDKMNLLLYKSSYMENIKKLSSVSKLQMLPPRESAVWWVEYVLKSGGNTQHLKPNTRHLSWFVFHGLDVTLFILTIILAGIYLIYFIVKFLLKLFFRKIFYNKKIKQN